jgi:hypothetical protein
MKIRKLQMAIFASCLAAGMSANAAIVTFNDLTTPYSQSGYPNWGVVPTGYGGLNWEQSGGGNPPAIDWEVLDLQTSQSAYGGLPQDPSLADIAAHGFSAGNFAYNGGNPVGGLNSLWVSDGAFTLNGLYVSTLYGESGYGSTTLTLIGYLNGVQGATITTSLTSGFVWWDTSALGEVDTIVFQNDANGSSRYFAIDDLNYTPAANTPVPEPTTMVAGAMLLLPFGASTLRMFRKTRTA